MNGPGLKTGETADKLIMFLHGYGSSGDNVFPVLQHWGQTISNALLIAPNAPFDYPDEAERYQWFALGATAHIKSEDIHAGLDQIRPFIVKDLEHLQEEYHIPWDKVVVAGFSQGGMVALDLIAHLPDLKHAICYGGSFHSSATTIENAQNKSVLLIHGDKDTVIPYAEFEKSVQVLKDLGIQTETLTCVDLEHSISAEGIEKAQTYLSRL